MPLRTILAILLFTILHPISVFAQTDTTRLKIDNVKFSLPGKWKRLVNHEESAQYGFLEVDKKTNIAISVRAPENLEFYKRRLKNFDLVSAYWEWDSNYWKNDGVQIEKLEENKTDNYIIWKLRVPRGENIFLFGLKSGKLISIALNNSDPKIKMTNENAIAFLTSLYK